MVDHDEDELRKAGVTHGDGKSHPDHPHKPGGPQTQDDPVPPPPPPPPPHHPGF